MPAVCADPCALPRDALHEEGELGRRRCAKVRAEPHLGELPLRDVEVPARDQELYHVLHVRCGRVGKRAVGVRAIEPERGHLLAFRAAQYVGNHPLAPFAAKLLHAAHDRARIARHIDALEAAFAVAAVPALRRATRRNFFPEVAKQVLAQAAAGHAVALHRREHAPARLAHSLGLFRRKLLVA